jgi:hypothetical protein
MNQDPQRSRSWSAASLMAGGTNRYAVWPETLGGKPGAADLPTIDRGDPNHG